MASPVSLTLTAIDAKNPYLLQKFLNHISQNPTSQT